MNIYNAEQLAALNRMGQLVAASLNLPVVLNRVIEEVPRLLETEGVGVLLPAGEKELIFAVVSGEGARGLQGKRMPAHAGVAGTVMRTGRPVKVGHQEDQTKIYRAMEKASSYHTQSLLAVPLILRGEVIGVLEAVHRKIGAYTDDDLRILEAAAVWVALAINNAHLYEKAQQEIAERKVIEAALRASEARYRTLTELAPVGIFSTDKNGCFTYVNDQWCAIVGLPAESAKGTGWTRSLHPDDHEHVWAEWTGAIAEERPFYLEFRYQTTAGETVWVLGQAVAHRNPGGNIQSYIGTITDMTEREAMRQAQKLAGLGALVGTIAHDFNNLLSAVYNYSELALMLLTTETDAAEHIKGAMKASKHASRLTQQLLAYSGIGDFTVAEIDLNDIIRDSVYLLEVAVPRNVQLKTNLYPESLSFRGSTTQMQQVIMNLIINAAESLQEQKGTVSIKTGLETVTAVQTHAPQMIEPIKPGPYVTLDVQDNGCGIAPDIIAKIFDPFFTTKTSGHGLGLAAVLGIIRQLHGGIQIDSAIDEGTQFRIFLPAEKAG